MMTYIKTISNGWCTSSRFHEPIRYSCIFGCDEARDELRHYLCCPTFVDICANAVRHDIFQSSVNMPNVLSTLGLVPKNHDAMLLTYVLFSVYHKHKRDWDAGCYDDHILSLECQGSGQSEIKHITVGFPKTTRDSLCAVASAFADKLEILRCSHARYRRARRD